MNMVTCTERCKHQHDGFCMLENGASLSASTNQECCFFEPISSSHQATTDWNPDSAPQFF